MEAFLAGVGAGCIAVALIYFLVGLSVLIRWR